MENAAASWVHYAEPHLDRSKHTLIFCGSGNNGGDGYAIARIMTDKGYQCSVVAVSDPKTEDCRQNAEIWKHYGKTLSWESAKAIFTSPPDCIIDSILGTGAERAIEGRLAEIVQWINKAPAKVLSVDMPTGVNASTGDILNYAVHSDITITFQLEKVGHHLFPGKSYCGKTICAKISIKENIPGDQREFRLVDTDMVREFLPVRVAEGYKNLFGHLLVWAGSPGTLGAAYLAAKTGLISGAGLVTAALPKGEPSQFVSQVPECLTHLQENITLPWLNKFSAVVVGCGLGRQKRKWRKIVPLLSRLKVPVVVDADAFHGVEQGGQWSEEKFVLTPHPGEFAALTGFKKPENNAEKIDQALQFVANNNAVLVLKGAPTIIVQKNSPVYINSTGNEGMATAGSGDVLAGLIGGLLAQGLPPMKAALLGTWLHGKSGDRAREKLGSESLIASSLIHSLSYAFQSLRPHPALHHP